MNIEQTTKRNKGNQNENEATVAKRRPFCPAPLSVTGVPQERAIEPAPVCEKPPRSAKPKASVVESLLYGV